jgi:Uma2 family endonuclease
MAADVEDRLFTAEELARMGIDGPCELVRGRIVRMSPAGARHGLVGARVNEVLTEFVRSHGLGLVVSSETGYWTDRDPDSVRAPDLAFVSHETIRRWEEDGGTFFPCAPDLAIEILSPDDSWVGVEEKVAEYLRTGGKLVWVLNPKGERVYVYEPGLPGKVLGPDDDLDGGHVLPGFRVPLARLFQISP